MNISTAILFLFLGVGIITKERWRGNLTKLLGLVTSIIVILESPTIHYFGGFNKLVDLLGGPSSLYEKSVLFLVGIVLVLSPRSILRKFYFVEFTTGLSFLFSALYTIGFLFKNTGILSYSFYQGAHPYVAILSTVFSLTAFLILRSRYETREALSKKLFLLAIIFSGVLFALSYASYVSNRFTDSNFDPKLLAGFVPTAIALLGVVVSVLVLLVVYAFSSLRERTVTYASEVTKGLRQAKAKDEAMLLSIGEGLVATGKDGNIVFVNRAFEDLMGWHEEEVQGKLFVNLVQMFDEENREIEKQDRPIYKILRAPSSSTTKATITSNMHYKRKDGTIFPVAITISPIVVEGQIIGAVEVFRDITEEKAVDKEKTEFVSLASHQLRTPLSSVNWYTEMLLTGDAGKLSKMQKEYVKEIYAGNQRMIDLVNDLLNVSRLELGTFSVNPEKVDIVSAAFLAIDEQKQEIKKKKIKMETDFPDERPLEIDADPKLLHMIFQNLLSNSVKYTHEKGNIKIAVLKEDDFILIKVTDNGIGIPKSQQEKIFTKLFRADNVKGEDVEGTGLGLYIIKSIIEESGGTISFESKEGEGTTFTVALPLLGMKKKEGSRELS
ncbi:MAG: PAS domain S-box protein [Candidatus Pacebacteria bacterium]|nr:PAS domain S-box protein [Candidatus Paceibacterota bacterium]MBP9851505.1 PAS domain S-box protein [Candidatus Paceibacterota bacterium]